MRHDDGSVMTEAADGLAVGLLGDVMLGHGVGSELLSLPAAEVWDPQLRALTASLDLVVCNLECCISARGEPTSLIRGKPFFFRAPPTAVDELQAIGARAVTLANNHALDFGAQALADTVAALEAVDIQVTGAGRQRAAAQRAAVAATAERRIAVVGATDHPLEYAATPSDWGIAYADLRHGPPAWLLREMAAAHEQADFVIAFPHWGPNMAIRPADWQRRAASALQEAGADLVAGHSAHLFHGVQWTPAGPILYDLGDALDDYRVDPEMRNDLGILAIWRPRSATAPLELVGLRLNRARTALAVGADADWITTRLQRGCGELGTHVTRIAEQRFRVEPGPMEKMARAPRCSDGAADAIRIGCGRAGADRAGADVVIAEDPGGGGSHQPPATAWISRSWSCGRTSGSSPGATRVPLWTGRMTALPEPEPEPRYVRARGCAAAIASSSRLRGTPLAGTSSSSSLVPSAARIVPRSSTFTPGARTGCESALPARCGRGHPAAPAWSAGLLRAVARSRRRR